MKRRSPLKRARPARPMSALDYSAFSRGVFDLHGDRCWACRTDEANRWKCASRSNGIVDAHHLVKQQTIQREVEPALVAQALADGRAGVPLARWHHSMVEACMVEIELPDAAWAWAADYGLVWCLERLESERAA